MPQFHETRYGRNYYESQLPQLLNSLNTIAYELKRSNDTKQGEYLKRIADEIAEYEPNLALILDEYMK